MGYRKKEGKMKKEYSVNIKKTSSYNDWNSADMADWCLSYDTALKAAEEAFKDPTTIETMVAIWEEGEIEDFPLHMVRESGIIVHYKNGERLWL